jgi:hypothetical protein
MRKKLFLCASIIILSLSITLQVVEITKANPVPFTQTPNLEKPILITASPQNYSTYTKNDIALNLTISQPDSWNAVNWLWHYVGEINKVEIYLDGNQTAEYTANHIYKYLNGNKTMIYPESVEDEFSLSNICDWINQTTPGMHTLNITVISHTYSLSHYPGSNEKAGAMHDRQPIYEYPIIVSDTIYFTNAVNSTPTPTTPELPFLSVITLLAVASVFLVYFKRRRGKA